ncbi:type II toxin-antitoxin system RelE/ParE family toxin [Rhizobium sp. AG855]|uniref:type II toxin-antitoxin system RelE/ParE family toxin n=1 Tax=Rhizobium sp. AG855 TaxID=2183898 RepID=UPI000E71AD45|nr:type II toxin-antitoxin system RelE/ParE family toxin [Rhizobium sp. AG855]RKE85610.1 plasmid stabilization system protein ParE [Rhizobium sp. AG855]
MISIRLSPRAADYIRRESAYLRDRSPAAAKAFAQSMKKARLLLQDFPEAGNRLHGLRIPGTRTLVVGDYLIDYRLVGSGAGPGLEIVTIRHGRMQTLVLDGEEPDFPVDE